MRERRRTELGERRGDRRPFYICRMIETLPLGTPFRDVAHAAAAVCQRLHYQAGRYGERPKLIVDATGLGRPVLEFFPEGGRRDGQDYDLVPTEITSGTKRTIDTDTGHAHLGKAMLVSSLIAALGTRRLLLPPGEMGLTIEKELHTYQRNFIKRGLNAISEVLGAPARTGVHDDEVTALGLCTSYPVGSPPPTQAALAAMRNASFYGSTSSSYGESRRGTG